MLEFLLSRGKASWLSLASRGRQLSKRYTVISFCQTFRTEVKDSTSSSSADGVLFIYIDREYNSLFVNFSLNFS